jgi:hypothetical protein
MDFHPLKTLRTLANKESERETNLNDIKEITLRLLSYCRKNDFAGYDPYDALNSELFKRLPFHDSRLPRLALTQMLKRSPINFRPLLSIPKTQNPKAIALFLMAFLKLEKIGLLEDAGLIPLMVQKLIDLRSPDDPATYPTINHELSTANCQSVSPTNCELETVNCEPSTVNRYYSWGYSFPWQGRSVLASRGSANLVCTVFVANALLDLYESSLLPQVSSDVQQSLPPTSSDAGASSEAYLTPSASNASYLEMATSAAEYLLNELYWSDSSVAGFSYPLPSLKNRVHNANFLGAALFCRVYKHIGKKKYLEPALKAARYSAKMQQPDGSWDYGEHETQHWVDNFHTGYNLSALRTICSSLNTDEFEPHIRRGFKFYRDHFFREDGAPKYFHNKTYPLDIHSVAQSILTLLEFRDLDQDNPDLANRVFHWAAKNMLDEHGYFYYQITPYYKNKIPYMRWSQAWMLLALATLLEAGNG